MPGERPIGRWTELGVGGAAGDVAGHLLIVVGFDARDGGRQMRYLRSCRDDGGLRLEIIELTDDEDRFAGTWDVLAPAEEAG